MKKCRLKCKREFPDHLIQDLVKGGSMGLQRTQACPICALEERNREAGLPKDMLFQGPRANEMYQEAMAYVAGQN